MKRISDDTYREHYKNSRAIGLRIKNNNLYIIGIRTEQTKDIRFPYDVHTYLPKNENPPIHIIMDYLISTGNLKSAIPWNKLEKTDKNITEFLSHIKNHEINGKHDKNDHDIFIINNESELSEIIDVLRDGDYLFVETLVIRTKGKRHE